MSPPPSRKNRRIEAERKAETPNDEQRQTDGDGGRGDGKNLAQLNQSADAFSAVDGAAQNPALGRIVWVDKTGKLGVVWLEIEAFPLLANATKANGAKAVAPNSAISRSSNEVARPPKSGTTALPSQTTSPSPVPAPSPLLMGVRDSQFTPLALVRAVHPKPDGRVLSVAAVRGTLREGDELFLPAKEMTNALERTLPLAEKTPANINLNAHLVPAASRP